MDHPSPVSPPPGHSRRLPARALAVLLVSSSAVATWGASGDADACLTKDSPITWLACQLDASPDLDPGPPVARLINSREGGPWDGVSWVFDQAQAVIAFTVDRDADRARQLLDALAVLQVRDGGPLDGTWCTSYLLDGTCQTATRRSGALAWVVVAENYYEWVEHDPAYSHMADAALAHLESLINTDPGAEEFGAVGLGPDLPTVYSAEHQADAYSAFAVRHRLRGGAGRLGRAEGLRSFLVGRTAAGACPGSGDWKVWLGVWQNVFNAGGACTPPEYYACPQTFALSSLGPPRPGEPAYLAALDSIWDGGAVEMRVTDVYRRPATYTVGPDDVQVEGLDLGAGATAGGHVYFIGETAGAYSVADELYGDGSRAAFLHAETAKVLYPDGGVPYSTDPGVNDPHKAVASTAWFYFNSADPPVNPLDPSTGEVGDSLRIALDGGTVRLTWEAVAAAGPVTYDVYRGAAPDALVRIGQTAGTSYDDDSPPPQAHYAVSLRR